MESPSQQQHRGDDGRPVALAPRPSASRSWRLSVHGAGVEIDSAVPSLHDATRRWVDFFVEETLPTGFSPASGSIEPYDTAELVRHLPTDAKRLRRQAETVEYYELDERFWVVDERWGMAEMNLLRGSWRSWILPNAKLDPIRCAEAAIVWPMAQVLRSRGVHLVPAVSVVRDGWGALIFCPFGLGPELSALLKDGYRIVGQRWTALRETDEGRVEMRHVPGFIERPLNHQRVLRISLGGLDPWVDLRDEHRPRAFQHQAYADAVLTVVPGRRSRAHLRVVDDVDRAAHLLRQTWPIPALHPQRRLGNLPAKLAADCGGCADVQLSRNPKDLVALLRSLRESSSAAQTAKLELSLTPWASLRSKREKLLAA